MDSLVEERYLALVESWKRLDGEAARQLLDGFALGYAYNSGKIENDAITYHDTHEVFEKGRVIAYTGDVRTLFEIQNLKMSWEWAVERVREGLTLDAERVLTAHAILTVGTYDERRWELGERPGAYKRGDYVVGVHDVGLPSAEVPEAVSELLEEVSNHFGVAVVSPRNAMTVAAYLHARLVEIHPFADGNGRTARLLANMLLLALRMPPIAIREQDRIAYFGALDAFHLDADLDPMRDFLMAESLMTWENAL